MPRSLVTGAEYLPWHVPPRVSTVPTEPGSWATSVCSSCHCAPPFPLGLDSVSPHRPGICRALPAALFAPSLCGSAALCLLCPRCCPAGDVPWEPVCTALWLLLGPDDDPGGSPGRSLERRGGGSGHVRGGLGDNYSQAGKEYLLSIFRVGLSQCFSPH